MSIWDWLRKPLSGIWNTSTASAPALLDQVKAQHGPYAVGTSGLHIWQLDPEKGTSINHNFRDTGVAALMKPSTFLELTTHSVADFMSDPATFQFYVDLIKGAKPFASPYLCLFVQEAKITVEMQEGRHRMAAILAEAGDDPVPVILHPSGASFDGPMDLAQALRTRPVIGRKGIALTEGTPFVIGTLARLVYSGRNASNRVSIETQAGILPNSGPL